MHASTEQLLALRDAEPCVAEVAAHVAACADCSEQLARLVDRRRALQALPLPEAPPADAMLAAILARTGTTPGARKSPLRYAAVAAAIAITLAALLVRDNAPEVAPATAAVPAQAPSDDQFVSAGLSPRGAALAERSAALERELRQLRRPAPAVVQVGFAASRQQFEGRVMALDNAMNRALAGARDEQLYDAYWTQRVDLLDTLVLLERANLAGREAATVARASASDR